MPPPEQLGSPTSPYQRLTATSQSNTVEADHLDDRPSHEESSVSDGDSNSYSSNDYEEDDDDDDEEEEENPITFEELMYSTSSFQAIVVPVSITMILASLAAVYINTEDTLEAGANEFAKAYTVWKIDSSNESAGKNLAMSIGNTFVMVCVIGLMTFGIVLLYKYRCMKILIGYMVMSSASLLGVLGDYMATIAIDIYQIPIDAITYYILLYNFAIVGVIAIFYQKGIPSTITQMYLVMTSVILAWHLSHFDAWTAWTLLVMLALYDLCAVLTPCGPLKALVNLMQDKDSPEMPGLLYEAHLPEGTTRPGSSTAAAAAARTTTTTSSSANRSGQEGEHSSSRNLSRVSSSGIEGQSHTSTSSTRDKNESSQGIVSTTNTTSAPEETTITSPDEYEDQPRTTRTFRSSLVQEKQDDSNASLPTSPLTSVSYASIPLAIARVYKLPFASNYSTLTTTITPTPSSSTTSTTTTLSRRNSRRRNKQSNRKSSSSSTTSSNNNTNESPLLTDWESSGSPQEFYSREFSATALKTIVDVELPRNGAYIETLEGVGKRGESHYQVIGHDGEIRRVLTVNREGRVFEVMEEDDDDESLAEGNSSIRLGLGDFIFYSVLVAKAALYSFTTFAACMLVILAGLGGTLVLLSVYQSALPALPISIFFGVLFYLLTRLIIEPWIEIIMKSSIYV